MVKKKTEKKSTNQILVELFMTQVGAITNVIDEQGEKIFVTDNLLNTDEIKDYSLEFMELLVNVLHAGEKINRRGMEYKALRRFFTEFSNQIQVRGGTLDEFIRYTQFLQKVFLEGLEHDAKLTFEESRSVLLLVAGIFNDISLDVFNVYLEEKERTIQAQQDELKQTSTPITEIWDGVLTLPIIGTLDSSRTVAVMENLLSRIEQDRARVVVMDITGVVAIDSQVSHHLIQMMRAICLMGARAILTGIRPEIARALTSLNINLGDVVTRSTLSEGLKEAFIYLGVETCTVEEKARQK
ncbi:MAG: STAS domain-containing protein [Gammaproteobacteria bacterium]|nr:STAS domain-containing protein [Gammaproteobacteria bacterium]